MGNYMACTCVSNSEFRGMSKQPGNSVKVVYPNGMVQEFHRPMVVAELMLESPQHFVWESSSISAKQRAQALPADAKLEVGQRYHLLPSSTVTSAGFIMSSKRDSTSREDQATQNSHVEEIQDDLRDLSKSQRLFEPFEIKQKGSLTQVTISTQYLTELMMQESNSSVLDGDSCTDCLELQMALRRRVTSKTQSWKPKLETVEEWGL